MSNALLSEVNPFAEPQPVADKARIRRFVKDLAEVSETVASAQGDLKEAIAGIDEVTEIDEQIKALRLERKELLLNHTVVQSYVQVLEEAMDDKKAVIADAKADGVPKGEIDLAIKALKKDLDLAVSVEIYANIADLIDP